MASPRSNTATLELIDILVRRAPDLIAVGVTSLTVDGLSVTLSPPPPKPAANTKPEPVAKSRVNPMDDPATYPSGRLPGFTRDEEKR